MNINRTITIEQYFENILFKFLLEWYIRQKVSSGNSFIWLLQSTGVIHRGYCCLRSKTFLILTYKVLYLELRGYTTFFICSSETERERNKQTFEQ